MEFKSRDVELQLGDRQGLYMSRSSGCPMSTAIARGWDDRLVLEDQYRTYMVQASTDIHSTDVFTGHEIFGSTKRKRPRFNNCDHARTSAFNLPFCSCYWKKAKPVFGDTTTSLVPFWRYKPYSPPQTISPLEKHFSVDIRNARALAWYEMQPRFEGDISMFNFLLELKEMQFLLNAITKMLTKGKGLGRLFSRRNPKFADPTAPVAAVYLTLDFGLKPLLKDFFTICEQSINLVRQEQLKFLSAGLGGNTRHHTELFTVDEVPSWSDYYVNLMPHRFEGQVSDLVFTATMDYSYSYSMRPKLDAFLRYWGVTPTWKSMWDSFPFSFLADYFSNIGRSIAAMETDPNVYLDLSQYCESTISRVASGSFLRPDHYIGGIVLNGTFQSLSSQLVQVAGRDSVLYSRKVCDPYWGPVLPKLKLPSSKQGQNMAALLRCFF